MEVEENQAVTAPIEPSENNQSTDRQDQQQQLLMDLVLNYLRAAYQEKFSKYKQMVLVYPQFFMLRELYQDFRINLSPIH